MIIWKLQNLWDPRLFAGWVIHGGITLIIILVLGRDGNGSGGASTDPPLKPAKETHPEPKPWFGWKCAPAPEPDGEPDTRGKGSGGKAGQVRRDPLDRISRPPRGLICLARLVSAEGIKGQTAEDPAAGTCRVLEGGRGGGGPADGGYRRAAGKS